MTASQASLRRCVVPIRDIPQVPLAELSQELALRPSSCQGRRLPLRDECFAVPERVVRLVEVEQHDRHEHRLATGEGLRDCAEA